MNIEELKTAWRGYEHKLSVTQRLSEQMIMGMLQERSRSRVAKMRRGNNLLLIYLFIVLAVLAGIFTGNPFDFRDAWQYIPYGVLAIGVLMAMLTLFRNQQDLNADLNATGLALFLKKIIEGYEKTRKMESWFGILMFSAGIATVFSFLPKKLEHKELWPALGETAIGVLITLLIYVAAYKAGAFKNRKKQGFENDLRELNELKAISSELGE
jgi:hypothetical protein